MTIDSLPGDTALPRTGSNFARLSRRVAAAGLMRRRPGYYVLRFLLVGALAAGTATAFLLVGDSPWQLLVAAGAAVTYGQIALLAHDVAHRQVFRTRRAAAITGRLLGNLGIGMSYGWWMDKHTRHHANPTRRASTPTSSRAHWSGPASRPSRHGAAGSSGSSIRAAGAPLRADVRGG